MVHICRYTYADLRSRRSAFVTSLPIGCGYHGEALWPGITAGLQGGGQIAGDQRSCLLGVAAQLQVVLVICVRDNCAVPLDMCAVPGTAPEVQPGQWPWLSSCHLKVPGVARGAHLYLHIFLVSL